MAKQYNYPDDGTEPADNRGMEKGTNRCLYDRPQAHRDQLFFPNIDKIRLFFITAGF